MDPVADWTILQGSRVPQDAGDRADFDNECIGVGFGLLVLSMPQAPNRGPCAGQEM